MNLNPFELRTNDYKADAMFKRDKWGDLCAFLWDESYGSYEYLLKGINTEINWRVICYAGSYQGELYCFGEYNDKFYYVSTGYGSCSGCDWYQAKADDIDGLQEIQNSLKNAIREFESIEEFKEWFNAKEVSGWYREEADEFLHKLNREYSVKD